MKKVSGTTHKGEGWRARCAICGDPYTVGYQTVGGMEIHVCRRLKCVEQWKRKVKHLEELQRPSEQEAGEDEK